MTWENCKLEGKKGKHDVKCKSSIPTDYRLLMPTTYSCAREVWWKQQSKKKVYLIITHFYLLLASWCVQIMKLRVINSFSAQFGKAEKPSESLDFPSLVPHKTITLPKDPLRKPNFLVWVTKDTLLPHVECMGELAVLKPQVYSRFIIIYSNSVVNQIRTTVVKCDNRI